MIPAAALEMPDGFRVQTPPLDEDILTGRENLECSTLFTKAVTTQESDDHTSAEAPYDQVRIEPSNQSSGGDHTRQRMKIMRIESLLI